MNRLLTVLDHSMVYRAWMAPFAEQKLAPVLRHADLRKTRRVLDVGCGPGTNAAHFTKHDYTGIDLNAQYLEDARSRFPGRFVVADVTRFEPAESERYDLILVNSLLHHLDDPSTARLLDKLASLLAPEGDIHILELVLPESWSPARLLASWDRGKYARSITSWRRLFEAVFATDVCQPYRVRCLGLTLWHMLYFKGRARGD